MKTQIKKYINTALLIEQLKRFWPIAAISMLGYVLLIVQPVYFPANFDASRVGESMLQLLSMRNAALMIAMVAVPFCTALALFSYPYRVASALAFHSMPVNKKQLFFTHVSAGLILMLVPLLLLSLVILVPVYYWPWQRFSHYSWVIVFGRATIESGDIINTFPRVVGFFLRNAIGFTLYFAVFVFAASLAGNRVIAVILSAVLALLPIGIVGLVELISSFYIFGYGAFSFYALETVATFTQPVGWFTVFGGLNNLLNSPFERSVYPLFISYGLISIIASVLAYFAYHKRPLEMAGDTVAFITIKRIFIFLFALLGMVLMGVFWLNTSGSRVGYYVGFVAGFIIAYFVAQMLAEKTFRVGHKAKELFMYGAVALCLYVGLLLVTTFGFWGYVRNVPSTQDIAGVHISARFGTGMIEEDHFFIRDPETIERVREIHEAIISQRRYLWRVRWGQPNFGAWHMRPINIAYQLVGSDRVMHRSYHVTMDFLMDEGLSDLLRSPEVALSRFPTLARPEVIQLIDISYHRDVNWALMQEIERARVDADREGISLEEALGERGHILEIDLGGTTEFIMHDHVEIVSFVRAVQADIADFREDRDWGTWININIHVYGRYRGQNWGERFLSVPAGGYVSQWIEENWLRRPLE